MRRIAFASLILFVTSLYAQVPSWLLHPKYDSIEMLGYGRYLVSNNGKFGMMDAKEKEIVPLKYEKVSPFHSHAALLFDKGKFIGYMNDQGRVKEFHAGDYEVARNSSFYDGYLLVHNASGYYYIRATDDAVIGPFTGGVPFQEGYAVVKVPKNPKKVLDGDYTIRVLSAKSGKEEPLKLGEFDVDDIDFMSSVSKGKSIIVLKKRFHEYDFSDGTLTPIHLDNNLANKKSRVIANERPVIVTSNLDGYNISFKQGQMTFDPLLRLTSISYIGQDTKKIAVPEEVKEGKQSSILTKSFPNTDLLGLDYDRKEILTAQFEKVGVLWGNEAIVMVNGKYGIVTVDPNKSCRFVLNDNMPIGFEHKTAITNIKSICPSNMNPSLMTLSSRDENCQINSDTRKENSNVEATALTYQCSLKIPEDIGLEKSSATTQFALNYDGLKLTPTTIPFDAWYVNNYTVQVTKHAMEGSTLTAEIQVNYNSRDDKNFFRNVTIEAEDSVECSLTKINEDLFSARFYGWKDKTVRFSVDITEDGCPTLSYARSISVGTEKKAADKTESETPVEQAKIKHKTTKSKPAAKEKKKMIMYY